MKAKFHLENPATLEATMTITMPMGEWRQLKDQLLSKQYPASELARVIAETVTKAETVFWPDPSKAGVDAKK